MGSGDDKGQPKQNKKEKEEKKQQDNQERAAGTKCLACAHEATGTTQFQAVCVAKIINLVNNHMSSSCQVI